MPTFKPKNHLQPDEVGNKYGDVRLGQRGMHCHRRIHAGDDPIAPKCYPSRFFQWWNSVFPHPASELTNGATRRTDSRYFDFCSVHHLLDHTASSDDQPDPTFSGAVRNSHPLSSHSS
ncbi:hypothetical protein AX14_002059 [Amanita brunnescens Koide BX004]|nr:hypothetical protein AX14_002059 [Amanita brunnescens Koide BX004]